MRCVTVLLERGTREDSGTVAMPYVARARAWVQVGKFWKKAERVVQYKRQMEVEARKKVAMDKHLTFLLDQTTRYSQILAQRLQEGVTEGLKGLPALAPPAVAMESPAGGSPAPAVVDEDADFVIPEDGADEEDDEATLEEEEVGSIPTPSFERS